MSGQLLTITVAIFLLTTRLGADASGLYTWKKVSGPTVHYNAVAFNDNVIVAVGPNGTVATSGSALEFELQAPITAHELYDVAWDGTQFIAVGREATILTSHDGAQWLDRSPAVPRFGTRPDLTTVATTDSAIIAAGLNGLILVSDDGKQWTNPFLAEYRIVASAWTGSEIYLAAEETLLRSADGSGWSVVPGAPTGMTDLIWDGERLTGIAGNRVYRSSQGDYWSEQLLTSGSYGLLAYNGNRLIALGAAAATAWSDDGGETWTELPQVDYSGGPLATRDLIAIDGIFVAVGYGDLVMASTAGDRWTRVVPPELQDLYDVVASGDSIVAVGDRGTVLSSPDGTAWTTRDTPTVSLISGLARHGSDWIAINAANEVMVSLDLDSWSVYPTGSPSPLYAIASNGQRIVVVGEDGIILVSSDLQTWTTVASPTGHRLTDVHSDGSGFAATSIGPLGADGFGALEHKGEVLHSSDGIDWILEDYTFSGALNTITSTSEGYIVAGDDREYAFRVLPGGRTRPIGDPTEPDMLGAAASDTTTVLVGEDGSIRYTANSSSTISAAPSPTDRDLGAVTWTGTQFVAVGAGGVILRSDDGIHWRSSGSAATRGVHAIAYGNGTWVVGGDNPATSSSRDGRVWTGHQEDPRRDWDIFEDILWDGGQFVAAGTQIGGSPRGFLSTSPDGAQWTRQYLGTSSTRIHAITRTTHGYAACGSEGVIYRSPDGTNWTLHETDASPDLRDIAHGENRTVAVGLLGDIVHSDNDTDWTLTRYSFRSLEAVAWGDSRWLAGGDGIIIGSPDGIAWDLESSLPDSITALHWTGEYWMAGTLNGRVLVSSNGSTWRSGTQHLTHASIANFAAGGNRLFAVGQTGLVLSARRFRGPRLSHDQATGPTLLLDRPVGGSYELQVQHGGIDGDAWQTLRPLESGDGSTENIPIDTDNGSRFFRVLHMRDF